MHPSVALQLESDDSRGAARALLRAVDYISGWPRKPELALQAVEPYQAFGRYRSTSENRSVTIVSQVCGTTGDCHLLLGDIELAALWYQLSVRYTRSSGFPVAYARLVVAHKLHDHFRPALDALRESRTLWHSRPWWLRLRDFSLAFVWLNKCHPQWIRCQIRDRNLLAQLEELMTNG